MVFANGAKDDGVVKYVEFKVYDPVYIALEMKMFDKYGVKVELQGTILGGPTAIQAVSSGQYNAGLASYPALINANLAGLPVIGVVDIQSAVEGQPLEEYFVRGDSDIKTVDDLKGKSFAVNLWRSSFHYTALMELKAKGIDPKEVNFQLLSFANQIPAITENKIDVVGLMEPYATSLKRQGNYRVLFNANDVFGNKQFCPIFVNRIWAENNPEKVTGFVSGIVDAINWIENNQDAAKVIIAKYTGMKPEDVPAYHFQKNGAVIEKDIQFWIDSMVEMGDIKPVVPVNKNDIGTNRYNKKVAQ
jgi:NitT/TauT family transport system substrate-binding protein